MALQAPHHGLSMAQTEQHLQHLLSQKAAVLATHVQRSSELEASRRQARQLKEQGDELHLMHSRLVPHMQRLYSVIHDQGQVSLGSQFVKTVGSQPVLSEDAWGRARSIDLQQSRARQHLNIAHAPGLQQAQSLASRTDDIVERALKRVASFGVAAGLRSRSNSWEISEQHIDAGGSSVAVEPPAVGRPAEEANAAQLMVSAALASAGPVASGHMLAQNIIEAARERARQRAQEQLAKVVGLVAQHRAAAASAGGAVGAGESGAGGTTARVSATASAAAAEEATVAPLAGSTLHQQGVPSASNTGAGSRRSSLVGGSRPSSPAHPVAAAAASRSPPGSNGATIYSAAHPLPAARRNSAGSAAGVPLFASSRRSSPFSSPAAGSPSSPGAMASPAAAQHLDGSRSRQRSPHAVSALNDSARSAGSAASAAVLDPIGDVADAMAAQASRAVTGRVLMMAMADEDLQGHDNGRPEDKHENDASGYDQHNDNAGAAGDSDASASASSPAQRAGRKQSMSSPAAGMIHAARTSMRRSAETSMSQVQQILLSVRDLAHETQQKLAPAAEAQSHAADVLSYLQHVQAARRASISHGQAQQPPQLQPQQQYASRSRAGSLDSAGVASQQQHRTTQRQSATGNQTGAVVHGQDGGVGGMLKRIAAAAAAGGGSSADVNETQSNASAAIAVIQRVAAGRRPVGAFSLNTTAQQNSVDNMLRSPGSPAGRPDPGGWRIHQQQQQTATMDAGSRSSSPTLDHAGIVSARDTAGVAGTGRTAEQLHHERTQQQLGRSQAPFASPSHPVVAAEPGEEADLFAMLLQGAAERLQAEDGSLVTGGFSDENDGQYRESIVTPSAVATRGGGEAARRASASGFAPLQHAHHSHNDAHSNSIDVNTASSGYYGGYRDNGDDTDDDAVALHLVPEGGGLSSANVAVLPIDTDLRTEMLELDHTFQELLASEHNTPVAGTGAGRRGLTAGAGVFKPRSHTAAPAAGASNNYLVDARRPSSNNRSSILDRPSWDSSSPGKVQTRQRSPQKSPRLQYQRLAQAQTSQSLLRRAASVPAMMPLPASHSYDSQQTGASASDRSPITAQAAPTAQQPVPQLQVDQVSGAGPAAMAATVAGLMSPILTERGKAILADSEDVDDEEVLLARRRRELELRKKRSAANLHAAAGITSNNLIRGSKSAPTSPEQHQQHEQRRPVTTTSPGKGLLSQHREVAASFSRPSPARTTSRTSASAAQIASAAQAGSGVTGSASKDLSNRPAWRPSGIFKSAVDGTIGAAIENNLSLSGSGASGAFASAPSSSSMSQLQPVLDDAGVPSVVVAAAPPAAPAVPGTHGGGPISVAKATAAALPEHDARALVKARLMKEHAVSTQNYHLLRKPAASGAAVATSSYSGAASAQSVPPASASSVPLDVNDGDDDAAADVDEDAGMEDAMPEVQVPPVEIVGEMQQQQEQVRSRTGPPQPLSLSAAPSAPAPGIGSVSVRSALLSPHTAKRKWMRERIAKK